MFFKKLNITIKNNTTAKGIEVKSTTINAKTCYSELKAYDQNIFWNLDVLVQINKDLYPVSFTELLIHVSQFSYVLLLCEEIGKYSKGIL